MIIIIKAGQEHVINELQQRFSGTNDVFVHENRVALEGVTVSDLTSDERAAAEQIIDNPPKPFKAVGCFTQKIPLWKLPIVKLAVRILQ